MKHDKQNDERRGNPVHVDIQAKDEEECRMIPDNSLNQSGSEQYAFLQIEERVV